MTSHPLAEYLRARRAATSPTDVGLRDSGGRRVPGLRREEVAMLADMSVDYYTRLEQGRERSPSPQMIDALSRALHLDHDGREHLHRLAGLGPRPSAAGSERVDPELRRLLDAWPDNPAIVLGCAYDVLAGNHLGEELFSHFPVTRNLAELVFLDPAARSFYADWHTAAENTVAGFRLLEAQAPDHPRIREVREGLQARSSDFVEIYAQNRAAGKRIETKHLIHPEVGPLTLTMLGFDVRSAPGQQLIVYHAQAGTADADAISLLRTRALMRAGTN